MLDWVMDLIGGSIGADRQAKHDKEMAQNSVSWRVADAQRAGISPLAALGVQGFSASDVMGQTPRSDFNSMIQRDIMKEKLKQEKLITRSMAKETIDQTPANQDMLKRPPATVSTPQVTLPEVDRGRSQPLGVDGRGNPFYGESLRPPGYPTWKNYSQKSAEGYASEYGELGDWVGGFLNALEDAYKNAREHSRHWKERGQ